MAARTGKDAFAHGAAAKVIANLIARVVTAGKEIHILLLGCNTIEVVPHLIEAAQPSALRNVWVLCTDEVWPSDLAPFLWHHYGGLVERGDMQQFRSATRTILGEYTAHYNRQKIDDESLREARSGASAISAGAQESLANAVYLDRLDRVKLVPGGTVKMARM